jgi:hypothetical protein
MGDSHPVGWMEAKLTAQGGEFLLHAMAGNTHYDGSMVTLTWRS